MTDLGEQPTPEVEPGAPPPGGVDAIVPEDDEVTPVVPDLSTLQNPHVDAPEEVTAGEDTNDGASSDGASEPEKETQA